jgi:mannose/cellobiose epimerase-like protein (N-acyl-D-glucosamine 2-epimerase family)
VADGGDVLVSTLDPDGRVVELSAKRWSHILDGHPELAPHLESVTRAVREPDRRMAGRQLDEEWFYLEDAGPSSWLKVVVHYEGGRGRIVTAFGRRSMP